MLTYHMSSKPSNNRRQDVVGVPDHCHGDNFPARAQEDQSSSRTYEYKLKRMLYCSNLVYGYQEIPYSQ